MEYVLINHSSIMWQQAAVCLHGLISPAVVFGEGGGPLQPGGSCQGLPSWSAAAAAKLLRSCLTLCDPIDRSPPGSPVPGILQARALEWVAISFLPGLEKLFQSPSQAHCRTDTLPPEGDLGKKAKLGNVCGLLWKKTLFKPCSDAASKSTLHSGPCRSQSSGGTQALGAGRLPLPVRPPSSGLRGASDLTC